jgi:dinuclear metal center YbgI/SA1388 family protein
MSTVLSHLLKFLDEIAPLRLAGSWDNVGLLVQNVNPWTAKPLIVFLTNDLTSQVMDEAIRLKSNVIITYHPTPFASVKKITMSSISSSIILRAASNNIAIYSPHTALDSVVGGLNDWLVSTVCEGLKVQPLSVKFIKPASDSSLAALGHGDGRIATLSEKASLSSIISAIKSQLKLQHVQVAIPYMSGSKRERLNEITISSFAVCAGSGSSVLANVDADLYISGEMSHHDVLASVGNGKCVILTNHSNSERGYLPIFSNKLSNGWAMQYEKLCGVPIEVFISEIDEDPLSTF